MTESTHGLANGLAIEEMHQEGLLGSLDGREWYVRQC